MVDEVGDEVGYDVINGRGEWALVVGEYQFIGVDCFCGKVVEGVGD